MKVHRVSNISLNIGETIMKNLKKQQCKKQRCFALVCLSMVVLMCCMMRAESAFSSEYPDVNKVWNIKDNQACWIAVTANLLEYTGWISSAQDFFLDKVEDNQGGIGWIGDLLSPDKYISIPVNSNLKEVLNQKVNEGYSFYVEIVVPSISVLHAITIWEVNPITGHLTISDSDSNNSDTDYFLQGNGSYWYIENYRHYSYSNKENAQIVRIFALRDRYYPIGYWGNGNRELRNKFLEAYLFHQSAGKPVGDSSSDVHSWGPFIIQDFRGGDGYWNYAMIYNSIAQRAYVVRTGFWETFKNLNGNCRDNFLGAPRSDEYSREDAVRNGATWNPVGGSKIVTIQDFEFGHMEFYRDGCLQAEGCFTMYTRKGGDSVSEVTGIIHCDQGGTFPSSTCQYPASCLYAEPNTYRPLSYHVTAKIRKDLLGLEHGSIFELAWSMECGNDLIRLAGSYYNDNWGWQFSHDSTDDASGGYGYEAFRLATTFDAEYMFVELITDFPIRGLMSDYQGWLSPGDLYVNVGGSFIQKTGTTYGLALTSHSGDMNEYYDPYDYVYDWDSVQQGYLYKDVIFSTGTFEEYLGSDQWFEDGGLDPFGRGNNIPVHIAQYGQDLGYQGPISWQLGVPEPSTISLISIGVTGMILLTLKKRKK
ncbi:PEP-CTERM sorting domain-containing protein [candidate division KSB1 bacterium]|nr:PEP-CTERM sorting domain-containing protein [candidate division KSB1 bacterium]